MYEQLSLFCRKETLAINLLFGKEYITAPPTPEMIALVPKGEYVVYLDRSTPCVLYPVKIGKESIPDGHFFYHFFVDGQLYAGIFIGKEEHDDKDAPKA